ncbi:MAG: hypothetical protein EOO09_12920 [Chitinophagaceae bacterium]|nr:MAG: hypothetical protein EOO09_12920 [Chitinophagaceae bacterium]
MKFSRTILSIASSLLAFSSCNKEGIDFHADPLITQSSLLANTAIAENYVMIFVSQTLNIFNHDSSFRIQASAHFRKHGRPADTGPIIVDGRLITADSTNDYFYDYIQSNTISEGRSLPGRDIRVIATGPAANQTGATTATVPVPKEFYPTTANYPRSFVNRGDPLKLYWTADPKNKSKKISIDIEYYRGLSQGYISTLPDNIQPLSLKVEDNGSFTIPMADLKRFPKGSYVGITFTRVNYVNTAGGYGLLAYVEARTVPLLVTE